VFGILMAGNGLLLRGGNPISRFSS